MIFGEKRVSGEEWHGCHSKNETSNRNWKQDSINGTSKWCHLRFSRPCYSTAKPGGTVSQIVKCWDFMLRNRHETKPWTYLRLVCTFLNIEVECFALIERKICLLFKTKAFLLYIEGLKAYQNEPLVTTLCLESHLWDQSKQVEHKTFQAFRKMTKLFFCSKTIWNTKYILLKLTESIKNCCCFKNGLDHFILNILSRVLFIFVVHYLQIYFWKASGAD